MKREKKAQIPWGLYKLKPLLQVLGFWAFLVATIIVFALIVVSADKLRYFFIPALALYFGCLAAAGYWLLRRHEKLEERGLMGDELYYAAYPIDRWFHEKKLALRRLRSGRREKRGAEPAPEGRKEKAAGPQYPQHRP